MPFFQDRETVPSACCQRSVETVPEPNEAGVNQAGSGQAWDPLGPHRFRPHPELQAASAGQPQGSANVQSRKHLLKGD